MTSVAERHRALLDAVSQANVAFSALKRTVGRAPTDDALRDALLATSQICEGVLGLLDVLVDDEARETIATLESEGALLHLEDTSHRCCGPVQTAMGRLPHFHEVLNQIAQALFSLRLPRPHRFSETRSLWVRLKYTGGSAWGGGLLGRLEHVAHKVTWTDVDLEAIRRVATRARFLAEADDDALRADHCLVWMASVDGWLDKMAQNPGPAGTMLADLVHHAPPATPGVSERLKQMAALELLAEPIRAMAAELGLRA